MTTDRPLRQWNIGTHGLERIKDSIVGLVMSGILTVEEAY
jgi:hypothetical protein